MVAIEMEQQVWLRFGHRDDRGEKENHRGSSINKVKPAPAEKKQAKVKPFTTQTNKVTFPPKSDSI